MWIVFNDLRLVDIEGLAASKTTSPCVIAREWILTVHAHLSRALQMTCLRWTRHWQSLLLRTL